jgi:hypothetical protein
MNKSIRIRILIHVCHQAIVYYEEGRNFNSFYSYCEYIYKHLNSEYYQRDLPKFIKRMFHQINSEIKLMFGFDETETLGIVIDFFNDREWERMAPIVFELKKYYDSVF